MKFKIPEIKVRVPWRMIICLGLILVTFFSCGQQKRLTHQYRKPKTIPKRENQTRNSRPKTKPVIDPELKITMNFDEAKLRDVLKIIAKEFKINLTIPNDDSSKVTVYLFDAKLQDALEMILSSSNYSYFLKNQTFFIIHNQQRITRIFPLKYAKATEIQKVIESTTGSGTVTADELTNSLVVTDEAKNLQTYKKIISKLDTYQPSVMIEADIYEISLDRIQNLGTAWEFGHTKEDQNVSGKSTYNSGLTNLLLDYQKIKNPLQVKILLNALRTSSESRLLSHPRIVTMNGREAKILVGERVPYVRSSTTTSGGNVMQDVEFIDVGILLKVTPRVVQEERLIFIDVAPEVSEVMDMEVQGVPRIGTREAKTRVVVKDGETIVIGGLIKNNNSKSTSTIPILGQIPLIKWFVSNKNDNLTKRELLVFVTPHILTDRHYEKMNHQKTDMRKRLKLK